jgi:integrase
LLGDPRFWRVIPPAACTLNRLVASIAATGRQEIFGRSAWLDASAITTGPLFVHIDRHSKMHGRLSGNAVAEVVKRHTGAVGLDATKYAGHSLRAGLVTAAAIAGCGDRDIMRQTGHRSSAMVNRYIRDASLFRSNVAATVGL